MTSEAPQLSVVMPVYNGGRFLQAAVDSILAQTFTDFECIIIDDCSTDNSSTLLQRYTDPRVRVFRNEQNRGISYSLNRGIECARSEWIVRMDSDDISHPNRLERQLAFMRQHPDGALYSCGVQVMNEAEEPLRTDRFDPEYYYYNLYFFCIIYHPTVVMRRQAVLELGGYTVPYAEDFELFWQLAQKHKIYHQNEVLLNYRQSGQSLHQVVRKAEYETATMQQLLRNLRTATNSNLQIPLTHLHCLQHHFEPIEQENDVRSIARCLRTLRMVSAAIAQRPNPNNIPAYTQQAADYKRRFILEHFMRSLPPLKAVALLALLGEWRYLRNRVATRLQPVG